MAYVFRFETVLNQRDWVKKKAEKELGEVQALLIKEKERLENLRAALDGSRGELHERQRKQTTLEEVMLYNKFIEGIKQEMLRQEQRVAQLSRLDAEKREILMKANGEVKIMEILKEKDLENFRRRIQKNEEKFVEEVIMVAENHKLQRR